jgi:hypothetical protein
MDEIKLTRDQERGFQAQTLIDNPLLNEIFETLETSYIEAWKNTDATQVDVRENFWRARLILADVKLHLQRAAAHGRLAQKELEALAYRLRPRAI